ncbi:hypothetical protein JXB27_03425 [Candidatus Woesearchaeota archaeon]|nr:hypothetical protein [Candidatus Woesearchaeota archaeon]
MEPQQMSQPRQIAHIVAIKDIKKSKFFKEEGWNPNFVLIGGKNVSRVSMIGTIIDCSFEGNIQNITFDDGTDSIKIKNFNSPLGVSTGDVVLFVGRIRKYGNEIYLTPEILKKNINLLWGAVWKKLCLKKLEGENEEIDEDLKKDSVAEEKIEEDLPHQQSFREKIIQKIKELDSGDGVLYDEIIKSFSDENYISKMVLEGDLFEIKPGRLKVLD